ncbi:MAG: tRNA preQ1(34) S-adenosylmethionine ribosyltransferase-isomerase QueA [Phycisphaerae bacterium]
MRIEELDYELSEELIAQTAIEPRDHSRLLIVNRTTGEFFDRHFYDLPEYLASGDVLVLNDTKVIPARVIFYKTTKGKVEGLFLREIETGQWEMMFRGMAKLRTGIELRVEGSDVKFFIGQRLSSKSFELITEPKVPAVEFLEQFGQVPLPPYIQKGKANPQDRRRYQTVFANSSGAVAAPTAGLHFTNDLLDKIKKKGVNVVTVTLHVGLGTFEPVTANDLKDHKMHLEWYRLSKETAEIINTAKAEGKKVIPVGTTSVRVLETAATEHQVLPGEGWTEIFIYPRYRFNIVDQLVTNFHLPRTTLLAMIFAFAGKDLVKRAYQHAIENRYRFYSYGDAMLIL